MPLELLVCMHGLVPAAGRDPNRKPIRLDQLAIPSTMTPAHNLDFRTRDGRTGILGAIPISRGATQIAIPTENSNMNRPNTTCHIQRLYISYSTLSHLSIP